MAAATVYISESNGAGEVVTDNISNINFGSVDQPNIVAANHPIIQGEYSYSKFLRFKVASLGTSTTIKDLRMWKSAGVLVSGESFGFNAKAPAPTISDGQYTANLPAYAAPDQLFYDPLNAVAFPVADPGGSTIGIAGNRANTLVAPGYGDYFKIQLHTDPSTPVGPVNTKTFTLQYDET